MAYQESRLSLLYRMGEEEAYTQLKAALDAEGGNLVHTAERLGMSHRTLCRWVAGDPRLEKLVDSARKQVI